MSILDPRVANTVIDSILSSNDEILSISIFDMKGNIVAAKSKEYFSEALGVSRKGNKYGVSLVDAVFGLIHLARYVTEEAKAVITIHENCKLMLLPLPPFQILVGLILEYSVNAQDYNIANKIERLMVDKLWRL
jgi:hypothetical protein